MIYVVYADYGTGCSEPLAAYWTIEEAKAHAETVSYSQIIEFDLPVPNVPNTPPK